MNISQIITRIETLRTAIAYSRYMEKHMSIGEGIMCHQEIAGWYAVLDSRASTPRYKVTEAINKKVLKINEMVTSENWENPNELI